MYIQRLGQKIPCSLDKSLYVVTVFMGNMLIRSRCHNLQMSFCLKIAILFCEGGKEGAKEGVTSLLCTTTSSSKHRLKWVQTSSQIATGATRAHRGIGRGGPAELLVCSCVKLIINKQGGDDVLLSSPPSSVPVLICISSLDSCWHNKA